MCIQLLSFCVLSAGLSMGLGIASVQAQVTSDTTLNTTVTQSGNNYTITNGDRVGNNLFHSFGQFSVPTGGSAIFNNAVDVQNIFSRVTGGSVSNIDGLIRANGSANLFLFNPSGILFGPKASLNIGGSFIGTTANSVKFADGVEFSAVNLTATPLLTVSVPIGLQIGNNSRAIVLQNAGHSIPLRTFMPLDTRTSPTGLQVRPGQTLALFGGGISSTGGILSSLGGNLQLGSVQEGLVRLDSTLPDWGFDYSGVQNFADINLGQRSLVNASGLGGGSIRLQGRSIRLTDSSIAMLQSLGSQPSGQIIIHATERFELSGTTPNGSPASVVSSEALRLGAGANIQVTAHQLSFQGGGRVVAFTYSSARSGSITINATDSIELSGFPFASPINPSLIGTGNAGATGASGSVQISTARLRLLNSASISSVTFGTGAAGDVQVDATESIDIVGINPLTLAPSVITTGSFNAGSAGNLTINTARLSLTEGGAVGSSAPAIGAAGNILIRASESVLVSDPAPGSIAYSRIASVAEILDPATQAAFRLPPVPRSNSGSVTIETPLLEVQNGGRVTVRNDGAGNAGQLSIQANTLSLKTGFIEARTASGQGGNINLQVRDLLLLRQGSEINATSDGTGNGGNITIAAPIIAGFENSDIIANAVQGRGGNIQITTQGIFGLKFRPQLTPENDITASSEFGVNGTVQVNTIGVDPSTGLVELPVNLADPSRQISDGCAGVKGNQFVITGRGGVPENPTQALRRDRPWVDLRDPIAFRSSTPPLPTSPPPQTLTEATTWQRNPDGGIELVAISNASVSPTAPPTCGIRADLN